LLVVVASYPCGSRSFFMLRIDRVLCFLRQSVEPQVRINYRWGRMKCIGVCCCALVSGINLQHCA